MTLAWIWTAMLLISCAAAAAGGRIEAVAQAAFDGADTAVRLTLNMAGALCLWSAVIKIMEKAGLMKKLTVLLKRPLSALFPSCRDDAALEPIAANVSANLLGLGNAATPSGIKAARAMMRNARDGEATNDLCLFVVLNTASIQILPTTVAAVRSAAGANTPFDILPAVWLTSIVSATVGIAAAKLFAALWRKRK